MKKAYTKPAMRVVALQQRHHLLGMSGEISGIRSRVADSVRTRATAATPHRAAASGTMTEASKKNENVNPL